MSIDKIAFSGTENVQVQPEVKKAEPEKVPEPFRQEKS